MKKIILTLVGIVLALGLSACCCRRERPSCPKQCPDRECPKPRCGSCKPRCYSCEPHMDDSYDDDMDDKY